MNKYLIVRSPSCLIKDDLAGYGWSKVNFSDPKHVTSKELFNSFEEESQNIGRRRKAILRFFNIKKDDVVIIPLAESFAIGIATGDKSFGDEVKDGYNRVSVDYFKDKQGQVIKVPRNQVTEGLSSRLRVRPAVVEIAKFKEEIDSLIEQIVDTGHVSLELYLNKLEKDAIANFKKQMLTNLRTGQTYLNSGGQGLENLVLELMTLDGYINGRIPGKVELKGLSDIDVEATNRNSGLKTLVQVKHHKGKTSAHGLKQLSAVTDENAELWLITSASLSDHAKKYALKHLIKVTEGSELVDWIYRKQTELSSATRQQLGISSIPALLI